MRSSPPTLPHGDAAYLKRRGWIEEYFDRTAAAAWERLTSDAPVSGVRATVRAGRRRMRATLTGWLPDDLTGLRVLDAGCGPGGLAVELAERGARVVGVDLSPTLIGLARERSASLYLKGELDFRAGDMLDPALGEFDYVVAMDSLIHYRAAEMLAAVEAFAPRARLGILLTFAPRTPLLSVMHGVGRLFPRGDRAPAIEPVGETRLRKGLRERPGLAGLVPGRTLRIRSGFYTSQALELLTGPRIREGEGAP